MRLKVIGIAVVAVLFFMLITAFVGCEKIEPGYVGIEISTLGQNRGPQDIPTKSGLVFYNPFATEIIEFPVFTQTVQWTNAVSEGNPVDESFSFNTSDQTPVRCNISASYQLDPAKVPYFYTQFRVSDLNTFTHGFLRNIVRNAFSAIGSHFTVEQLNGPDKEKFLVDVQKKVNDEINKYGVHLDQMGFIGAIDLPVNIVQSIAEKIEATQKALKTQNEVAIAEAEARKKVAYAEGEAAANRALAASISPQLIEWRKLQLQEKMIYVYSNKWNGDVPKVITGQGGVQPLLQMGF